MGLAVIGAGFGRTGTMSLKLALEQLDYGPCHHMEEVFFNPGQLPLWQAAVAGEKVDWDAVFEGYNSTADWPGAHFWRELAAFYPDSKVVLTTRSVDSWWDSYSGTIMKFNQILPDEAPEHVRALSQLAKTLVGERTFGTTFDDERAGKAAYRNHLEAVTASIPADRLLCFDVRDGWEPLCAFLGKPVPHGAFPRANTSAEFWDNFPTD